MTVPGLIFVILFSYVPMFGIVMAFQDYIPAKGILESKFAGMENFAYMFSMPESFRIFRNTLCIALGKIVFGTLAAIIFSILLNEIRIKLFKKTVQTIVYLPHFISWVILASVIKNMLNVDGSVNHILMQMGAESINFLGDNTYFPLMLIFTDVWKEFGYNSIVYLAALTSIDPGLYEAATIDGASWWQRVVHVTLPGILPIIFLMSAMNLSNILNAGFDQVYNLVTPIVYESGDILDTWIYRIGLISRQYSLGTAVGLLKSVVGLILMLGANEMAKRYTDRKIF
ncbi:MAG: sugar ABC transporter permease [Lachnospiraceae bacterium]|nr:sugar ABC transporter permease [Lachnospiraceae bacterium]MCI9202512.1 sugar ABC transporter permease [Lachnospiraceae bacterium]